MRLYEVFDLDGTLVDTRYAVTEAYRRAGVTMPDEAWGKPWRDWCSPEAHAAKVAVYPEVLREYLKDGPAMELWRTSRRKRGILTGASWEAVQAICLLRPELLEAEFILHEMSWRQKWEELTRLPGGLYYDDDAIGADIVLGTSFHWVFVQGVPCAS